MKRRLLTDLNLVICVILGLLIVMEFSFKPVTGNDSSKEESYSEGWYLEDGTEADFDHLPNDLESYTISKTVSPGGVRGADLCFEAEK